MIGEIDIYIRRGIAGQGYRRSRSGKFSNLPESNYLLFSFQVEYKINLKVEKKERIKRL